MKTIKQQLSVKSLVTVAQVNTVLQEQAAEETAQTFPIGTLCDCPCPDPCLQEIKKLLTCCPRLDVGAAEFTTESSNGVPGALVQFPVTTPAQETSDFAVPISLGEYDCLDDPDLPIVVRWCFDHEPDPSTSHTGFNVSGNDGTGPAGAVLQSSNGQAPAGTHIGPLVPHTGPRTKQWVDIEFTVAQLQAGVSLQTSAFGTVTPETETIYSQDVSIVTDLAALGCC